MKAFYDKNGYFVYPKLVDMSKCNQMLESIRKHANKDYAAIVNPDRIDFLAQQSPIKNEGILRETAILMRNIMKDQSIVEVLECFQGERVVGLMSQMLFKEITEISGTPKEIGRRSLSVLPTSTKSSTKP